MIKEYTFDVDVSKQDAIKFAELSGDWNPLHTDEKYAAQSVYGAQVLHGAFSAGLISRLAGMYMPGTECLLYNMKLRFVNPILPPDSLVVKGKVVSESRGIGKVEATITSKITNKLFVEASYDFGTHRMKMDEKPAVLKVHEKKGSDKAITLVSGTSGGLGNAVLKSLGDNAIPITRSPITGRFEMNDSLKQLLLNDGFKIASIVHCSWPTPQSKKFIDIEDSESLIEDQIAGPIKDIQFLSYLIANFGVPNASLLLIGSTFAKSGRHYFRMPLYSIAKSTIPSIVDILSLELASKGKRCYGVIFDVLDGGMNKGISEATKLSNADRSPWGMLGTPEEAAGQINWLLENQSTLVNGSILTLTGGSIP